MQNLHVTFVLLLGGSFLCSGCGSRSELEKVIVKGQVTFDGKLVENGDILFCPMPGTKGPVSGASIKDGQYTAIGRGGVPVGEQLVRISAYRSDGTSNGDDLLTSEKSRSGGRIQYLPPEYNELSQITVTIKGDSQEFVQDFKLEKKLSRQDGARLSSQ